MAGEAVSSDIEYPFILMLGDHVVKFMAVFTRPRRGVRGMAALAVGGGTFVVPGECVTYTDTIPIGSIVTLRALIRKVPPRCVIDMAADAIGLALVAEVRAPPTGGGVAGRTLAGVMVPGSVIAVAGGTVGLAFMTEGGAAPAGGAVAFRALPG